MSTYDDQPDDFQDEPTVDELSDDQLEDVAGGWSGPTDGDGDWQGPEGGPW